ncbi:ferritin heavy chain B-like isoform X1 [Petromyzon marinus]|nr:ferritin heavy chain B-like isoform X1 [Petromyzon marinus]
MASQVRQNYSPDVEAAINRQVNMTLHASYVFLSLASYFDRDDVALKNFRKFFKELSDKEREHADKLLAYQNKRGGRVVLRDIKTPERDDWGHILEAMQTALQLQKSINQSLLDLHGQAREKNDPQLCEFLKDFLEEQVESIKKLGDHITNLKRLGVPQSGLGEYLYERLTLGDCS